MFKFRPLKSEDLPLMLKWLLRAHVKEWWNEGEDTLEKVAFHYGEKEEGVKRFILVEAQGVNEKPIGYFQYYLVPDGSIGIDQFIGEADYLNRGVGEQAIKMFIELIIEKHNPSGIILDPSPDNKRAIRCYEKVGFKYYETKEAYDGNGLAYMMRYEIKR